MTEKQDAILMGPFVGEFYWESGRFAPMLPAMRAREYKKKDIKYIILTREDRFDLYGKYADILIPLKIEGDYEDKIPECFRLIGFGPEQVKNIADKFRKKYEEKYNIIRHIYPDTSKGKFVNKNQFSPKLMLYNFSPRDENYTLIDHFLPKNKKKNVVISPRFRKGFKRNWNKWKDFYNLLDTDKELMSKCNFIICGKKGEYIPDEKNRFLDINNIPRTANSSLVGLLLVVLEKSCLVFGSQSAIPNIALLYGVEVLEFGCQKKLHTITYNVKNAPITFIENKRYDIDVNYIFKKFKNILLKKIGE
jgi:hypothetical protein